MVKLGFIGAGGIMGSGMAMNLVKKGFDVTVWNRSADKCKPLVDGACVCLEHAAALSALFCFGPASCALPIDVVAVLALPCCVAHPCLASRSEASKHAG